MSDNNEQQNKNITEDTFYISEEEIDEFLRESNLFDNDYFIYFNSLC